MLEWQTSTGGDGGVEIRLSGDLTEKVDLSELEITGDSVLLIADGVRHINSQGVKRLFDFIKTLAETTKISVSRCSPSFVHQLNMVPGLVQFIEIRSVIAPLECTECVAEADTLVPVNGEARLPQLPNRACEICGADMELAELEERYFAFAKPAPEAEPNSD